ncbi:MAG TPA: peptide chain release factor N(5)-glutamine methyltransferase [Acidimicrobiales bacterium]|nr:peptide chain release factor N(5)-glutamine methyltransferase [Acidimicrobiales bacterium]
MTWRELLGTTAGVLGARHEARLLLEEVAGSDLARLAPRLDEAPSPGALAALEAATRRRLAGEPLQYVLGHWGFRSLDLLVDCRALIPRPETEVVVEHALAELARHPAPARAADLGTGSGAIALALALEGGAAVVAVEASRAALELARANLERLPSAVAARVELVEGDFYEALGAASPAAFDCIVSNPPYLAVAEWERLDPVVRDHEPKEALVAGPTGLEAIEVVVSGAPDHLSPGGSLVLELAPHQADEVLALAARAGAREAAVQRDLAGRRRVLVARW